MDLFIEFVLLFQVTSVFSIRFSKIMAPRITPKLFQFFSLGDFLYIYFLFSYFLKKNWDYLENILLCQKNFVRFSYLQICWAFSWIFCFSFSFIIGNLFADIISYFLLIFLAFLVFTLTSLFISSTWLKQVTVKLKHTPPMLDISPKGISHFRLPTIAEII